MIPCFNYGHYLPQAVNSALDQHGVDVEVIVVDDCSTDGSEIVAKQLGAEHPEVQVMYNDVNLGHIRTYNRGLAAVSGDYVVLLSADDLLAPDSLTRAAGLFEAHPSVGLVYGYAPTFTNVPSPGGAASTWSTWGGDQWLRRLAHRGDNLIMNPEAVLRASLMSELGGYDPDFPHAADMLLWMRAAARSDVGRINGIQAHYREHGENMHRTDFAGTITDMRERLELYRRFFTGQGDGAARGDALRLLAAAERSIASEALWCACIASQSGEFGGASGADFEAMALDACADVAGSRLHRKYLRASKGQSSPVRARGVRMAYDVRWKLRWRRWRRWGT